MCPAARPQAAKTPPAAEEPKAEIWPLSKVTPVFAESAMNYSLLNQDRKDAVHLRMGLHGRCHRHQAAS